MTVKKCIKECPILSTPISLVLYVGRDKGFGVVLEKIFDFIKKPVKVVWLGEICVEFGQ